MRGGWVKGMGEVARLFTLAIRGLNLLLKSRHPKLTVDIEAVTVSTQSPGWFVDPII